MGFDPDRTGEVRVVDFERMLGPETGILPANADIKQIVRELDADNSGRISFGEFVEYFKPNKEANPFLGYFDRLKAAGDGIRAEGREGRRPNSTGVGDFARGVLAFGRQERMCLTNGKPIEGDAGYQLGDVTRGLVRAVRKANKPAT